MFRRVDPLESIDAQLRDLVGRLRECTDPDSAEVLKLLWRVDLLLDRRLTLRPAHCALLGGSSG